MVDDDDDYYYDYYEEDDGVGDDDDGDDKNEDYDVVTVVVVKCANERKGQESPIDDLEQYSRIDDVIIARLVTTHQTCAQATATKNTDNVNIDAEAPQEKLTLEDKVVKLVHSKRIDIEPNDISACRTLVETIILPSLGIELAGNCWRSLVRAWLLARDGCLLARDGCLFARDGWLQPVSIRRVPDVYLTRYTSQPQLLTRVGNSVQRRTYNTQSPQSLWRIDENHKLIRWKLVINGGIGC
ncbi:hypothetical protein LSAT2_024283 [Lamellibrachia satsuma]|nr:hypothetical protein LSAT2_024283 [Lamellibrachia satsuma]